MKEIQIPRNKIKNFLADRLTQQILQMNEETIYSMIRYEGIGGYNRMSDNDLFVLLVESIPEFRLLRLINVDENNLIVTVKDDLSANEDEITIDITRLLQMKLI